MTLWDGLTLFAAMTALALLPSTSVALVVSRSVSGGIGHGSAAALGVVAGDLIFVTLALLGMTALSTLLGGLFSAVRILAGLFLIYYGIQLWRRTAMLGETKKHRPTPGTPWHYLGSFSAGLGLTLADVKAIVFYASLLPVFVELDPLRPIDGAAIIAITVVSVGGAKLFYAVLARRATQLAGTTRYPRIADRAMGGGLIATGGYLIARGD